jgi:Zn-finger nucleic acid-binding protein
VLDRALSERGVQELRTVSPASASTVSCPDCQAAFKAIVVDDCTLDLCQRCHGVWLDPGEAQRVSWLFPEDSAIVDADGSRATQKSSKGAAAASVVEAVANLLILVFK